MSPQPRTLITPALLGWVAGTALQGQQENLFDGSVYTAVTLLSAISISFFATQKSTFWVRVLVIFCTLALLAFASCGLRAKAFAQTALPPKLEGVDVRVQGVVTAMAQRNAGGTRFRLAVESAEVLTPVGSSNQPGVAPASASGVPPLIYLGWYTDSAGTGSLPDIQPGQRWQMAVRLKAPHGNRNPQGFDYELWLWEQGLQATGYVRAARGGANALDSPRLLTQTWRYPVEQARQSVRDTILSRVADRRTAGIIAALVVGDQAAIERADWDVFRATGVAHLMSISGLHVTLFAWLAAAVVGWGWRRSARLCLVLPVPLAALVGGVILAGAYALFSGWGVPAQRTVLMLATVGALRWFGLRWPWPLVWLAAMAVVLAWDPWALLQAGFWLSFVAVGVLFASGDDAPEYLAARQDGLETGLINEPFGQASRRATAQPYFKLASWRAPVTKLLREQAVVTLALTPLTLLLFGQVSIVGLLANLLAIPWVTLVVTPLAMLGVLWQPLWAVCGAAVDALSAVLVFFASFPYATYSVASPAWWISASALFGGLILVLRLPLGFRALGLPLVLPLLLWQAPRPAPGQFEVIAADVGQGTAVLVRTTEHSLLYDAGPRFGADSDAGHRVLVPWLRSQNESLDTLVLSHRDSDHTGGAQAVLAMQPQALLLSSLEDGHSLLRLATPTPTRCIAGQAWRWDGVDFEILHPQAAHYEQATAGQLKPNGLSCVLRVSTPEASALLTGDIERAQEQALLGSQPPDKLKADWLLVPHHGSKTSSGEAWLAAVAPRWAVVQSGYRNRFGHPVPSVMQRYDAMGIQWVDSPHCGAASWSSTAPDAMACERQRGLRYWRHVVP